jgi:hypothetical protein
MQVPLLEDELRDRRFNNVFDEYLRTGKMKAEDYENCTPTQKTVVQCVKPALARIKHD